MNFVWPVPTMSEPIATFCLNDNHVFDWGSELCKCKKQNRHQRHQCECGDIHWLPRKSDSEPQQQKKGTES